ncbi:MAG: IclR family transcriptional regulator [Dehalococcoidales bacterium]|nr:IclR family transcriptional regulator [Dehalococcoidales bacterium]
MNDNDQQEKNTYLVPSVEQAIRVMLCLADNGGNPKSLTDICQEVDIHRSKAFSILNTLNAYGFVKKNPNRKGYVLGPGLVTLAGKMLETLSLPRLAEPVLYELAKKTEATVTMGVIFKDVTFTVAEYLGAPGMGVSSPIGYTTPITYGSHGKAIAAFLPQDELDELLKSKDLYFYGTPGKFDKKKLLDELAECRRRGFSLELGDIQPGMNAVAAPILDQNNYPVGYVTIVGFFSGKETLQYGPLVVEAVKTISKDAGHLVFQQKIGNMKKVLSK